MVLRRNMATEMARLNRIMLETPAGTADNPREGPRQTMNSEFSPSDPPLDIDRLREFSNNDPATLKELITLYLTQTTEQLGKLRASIEGGNAHEVNRISHSCVGSSLTCGMNHIVTPLRELEVRGRAGDLVGAALLCDQAAVELERLRQHLDAYLK